MRAKSLLLILVALVMAGGTALAIRGWLDAQRAQMQAPAPVAQAPAPRGTEILVAKVDIAAGQFIRPEHLRWQSWPDGALSPNYVVQGRRPLEDFVGAVARLPVAAGEPVTEGRVVVPGNSGFLAAVLQPGMRAVSVSVNATSGISGFVFPGDRIDLLMTHNLEVQRIGGRTEIRHATATVLQDLRVLAIDQTIQARAGEAVVARTATLEVTPRQSQLVAVASETGRLSLSLRSLARDEMAASDGGGGPGGDGKPAPGPSPQNEAVSFVMDSELSPTIPPLALTSEQPQITVLRGQRTEQIRITGGVRAGAGEAPENADDAPQQESPNRRGADR